MIELAQESDRQNLSSVVNSFRAIMKAMRWAEFLAFEAG
jgi:hypothetical protein